jgi:hypothetical protein
MSDRQAGTDAIPTTERTGLLIIRAWTEQGSSEPLRAQVRLSTDVSTGFARTLTLARAEAVCAAVQEWLAEILCSTERPV